MENRKQGLLNVSISIIFKIFILITSILNRRFLIQYLGAVANGLNSLYISLIGFLSVAELGVGTAITYCMYKPIVEQNNEKVSALYCLFKKLNLIVGAVILICGIILMPFLPILAKDYSQIDVNLYLTFGLMLVSVVLTYAFSAKISLINAYKNNYITTTITSTGLILQYIIQVIVVILTHSFVWYLACMIFGTLFQWLLTELLANKKYRGILKQKAKIDVQTRAEVVKNVKAMFMHKVGAVLVNTADSLIISAFIGVVLLGKYSNYTTIVLSMVSVISLVFTPLTAIIGQAFVSDPEKQKEQYETFFTFNFIIGLVFFLGYYAVIDNLVSIFFGGDLELSKAVSMVITINYFVQFMRQSTLLYRDATGTFYNDRWKPFFEGILNVILSIAFVILFKRWFGEEMGVVGVIVATIITNLTICHVIEPYVLFKHAFNLSPKKHWLKNYSYILIFLVAIVTLNFCMMTFDNVWVELLVNGCVSVGISICILILTLIFDKKFLQIIKGFVKK